MPKRNRPPHNLLLISPSISILSNTQCWHHRLVTVAHLLKIMSRHLLSTLLFFSCRRNCTHHFLQCMPLPLSQSWMFFFENVFQFIFVCFIKSSPNQSVTYCFCVCAPGWMLDVAHKTCGGDCGWKYIFSPVGGGGSFPVTDQPLAYQSVIADVAQFKFVAFLPSDVCVEPMYRGCAFSGCYLLFYLLMLFYASGLFSYIFFVFDENIPALTDPFQLIFLAGQCYQSPHFRPLNNGIQKISKPNLFNLQVSFFYHDSPNFSHDSPKSGGEGVTSFRYSGCAEGVEFFFWIYFPKMNHSPLSKWGVCED